MMPTFEELGILPVYAKALKELGFEQPMPVQEQVIPTLLNKQTDLVTLAQTGTGKTAAYGLPLIQNITRSVRGPESLVLCPTRELCIQIADDLNDFARYDDRIKILPVYGGASIDVQIKALKSGVQIVVATPGRLMDLVRRKAMRMDDVSTVVLDEADEMLNMGFLPDITEILSMLPAGHASWLFSATMPPEVSRISRQFMNNPEEITIGTRNAGAENIRHVCYTVHAKDKYTALKRIVDYYPSIYGIVFCRTRKDTQEIAEKLIHDGYNAEALHGELSQAQRDYVMQKFRIRHIRLLVATDVAARGIDVDDLTHIINYSLPDDIDAYTHRSGRTARAGKTGISIAITNLKERNQIRQIEKQIGKSFVAAKVPGGQEVCEKQLFHLIDKMERVEVEGSKIDEFLPVIYRKLDWMDKNEVIKRFVALEFNRFLEYYKDAGDINVSAHQGHAGEREPKGGKRQREEAVKFATLFLNKGKSSGIYPAVLIELVNQGMPGKRVTIGRIDLSKGSTHFEVDARFAPEVIKGLCNLRFEGMALKAGFVERKEEFDQKPVRKFKEKKHRK